MDKTLVSSSDGWKKYHVKDAINRITKFSVMVSQRFQIQKSIRSGFNGQEKKGETRIGTFGR